MIKTAAVSVLALSLVAAAAAPNMMEDQNRDVSGFDGVAVAGPMKVHVEVGGKFSVKADGSAEDLKHLETIVKRDTLKIRFEDRYKPEGKVRVHITMPEIDEGAVSGSGALNIVGASGEFDGAVSGSGDMEVSGGNFGEVELAVSGSGSVVIDGKTIENAEIAVSGSGDVKAIGDGCDNVEIAISGSGDINAKGLRCKNADVAVAGSGDISLHASNSFAAAIMGSGGVDVYGKPEKRDVTSQGSGKAKYK